MRRRIEEASALAEKFLSAEITALELEAALVASGFHSVQFNPPSAVFDGVRYPLTGLARYFSPSDWQRLMETF